MDCKYSRLYIFIVGCIIITIFFYLNKSTDNYDNKLDELTEKSIILIRKNDSLIDINKKLDITIDSIKNEKEILNKKLVNTKSEILIINKKRNEIPNYIKRLSANGVTNELTKYLDEKSKSRDTIR